MPSAFDTKSTKTSTTKDKKRVVLTATKGEYKVKEVAVEVVSANGKTIATGKANQISTSDWVYTIPAPSSDTHTIIITATDTLGRTTTKQFQC